MTVGPTRRQALRDAALASGAAAIPIILRPGAARAQEEDADLEDFLVEAVVLEQMTALAYATAIAELGRRDRRLRRTLERFQRQEQMHATALRSALDSIGVEPPNAPEAPDDVQGIEDVEALAEERKRELTDLLSDLDGAAGREGHLDVIITLEEEQLGFYLREAPSLDPEDVLRTGAEIAACQAQHVVVLREALGAAPADAVPDLPAAGD